MTSDENEQLETAVKIVAMLDKRLDGDKTAWTRDKLLAILSAHDASISRKARIDEICDAGTAWVGFKDNKEMGNWLYERKKQLKSEDSAEAKSRLNPNSGGVALAKSEAIVKKPDVGESLPANSAPSKDDDEFNEWWNKTIPDWKYQKIDDIDIALKSWLAARVFTPALLAEALDEIVKDEKYMDEIESRRGTTRYDFTETARELRQRAKEGSK